MKLSDFRKPPQKSQYELYPLPFFAAERLSTWNVQPTGKYWNDCYTGRMYAGELLRSCDGTLGWVELLPAIVADMIRAGPSGAFADGHARIEGVVIGFMSEIGSALAEALRSEELS
ncbi:MAG: hypothetical protein ABSA90_11740 [Xanthobacteraceae bacterium]